MPVAVVLTGLIAGFALLEKLPSDISLMIAILAIGGFACAEVGRCLPLLSALGAAAIFATFVPAYLVYAKLLPNNLVGAVKSFTKDS